MLWNVVVDTAFEFGDVPGAFYLEEALKAATHADQDLT